MSTKTSLLFIAALCLVQGIGAQISSLEEVIIDALKHDASIIVQSAVQDGANLLQAIVQSLIQNGQGILGNFSEQIQNITDTLNDAVQKGAGDVPKCVTDEQSVALQLLSNTIANLWQCVTVEGTQVGALVKEVASLAQQAFQLYQQVAGNVTVCLTNPFTAVICFTNIVTNVASEAQRIVAEVIDFVTKGEQLLVTAPQDIATCAAREVDNAASGFQQIIVSIAQCVADGTTAAP